MPTVPAYSPSLRKPVGSSFASSVPGFASKPVWWIAVLALLVPVPTSAAASTSAQETPRLVSSRAIAAPTTPAPTMATAKGPSGSGPARRPGKRGSAALEHPAPLVVGHHLVEQLLLELPVVQIVLPDGLTERLLREVALLPQLHGLA